MKATVLFTRPKKVNIVSKLIMAVQDFNCTHSAIMFEDISSGKYMVYEASYMGIRSIPMEKFYAHSTVMYSKEVGCTRESLEFFQGNLVTGYSYKALFGFLLKKIFRLKNKPFDDGESKMVCSEYVARGLTKSSYKFTKQLDDMDVKDLYIQLGKQ